MCFLNSRLCNESKVASGSFGFTPTCFCYSGITATEMVQFDIIPRWVPIVSRRSNTAEQCQNGKEQGTNNSCPSCQRPCESTPKHTSKQRGTQGFAFFHLQQLWTRRQLDISSITQKSSTIESKRLEFVQQLIKIFVSEIACSRSRHRLRNFCWVF